MADLGGTHTLAYAHQPVWYSRDGRTWQRIEVPAAFPSLSMAGDRLVATAWEHDRTIMWSRATPG